MATEQGTDGLIFLGPVGRRKDNAGKDLLPGQGYRASRRKVDVSVGENEIGDLTKELYETRFKRPQPWFLDLSEGVVVDSGITRRAIKEAVEANPDSEFEAPVTMRVIRLDGLQDEGLPGMLLQNVVSSWEVEMGLKDFSKAGQTDYGRSRGQSLAYHQWSLEESNHGALERIIAGGVAGGLSEKTLDSKERELSRGEWITPFETRRQMSIYAFLQEFMTAAVYTAMANQASEGTENEGKAPLVSQFLMLITKDESFHGAWFRQNTELYATLDRDGTEQDVYFVARHFRMPGDYFFTDPGATIRAYKRGLGYSQQSFARRLYEFMNRLSFVDRNKALLVAAEYAETIGEIGQTELEEMLEWPSEKLAQAFETDERLKEVRHKTQTEVLAPKKSKLVL